MAHAHYADYLGCPSPFTLDSARAATDAIEPKLAKRQWVKEVSTMQNNASPRIDQTPARICPNTSLMLRQHL